MNFYSKQYLFEKMRSNYKADVQLIVTEDKNNCSKDIVISYLDENTELAQEWFKIYKSDEMKEKGYECGVVGYIGNPNYTTFLKIPSKYNNLLINEISGFSKLIFLQEVIIENGIKEIFQECFRDCVNLRSINIPSSVKSLRLSCFRGCASLESIDISNIDYLSDEVFYGCINLKEIKMPKNLKRISGFTFCGCEKLKSIDLGNEVESIGMAAFNGCYSLKELVIPPTIKEIWSDCFNGMEEWQTVIVNKKKEDIKLASNWDRGCNAKIIFGGQ